MKGNQAHFYLGVCRCGCSEQIPIRSKYRPVLLKYKLGHNTKGKNNPAYKGGRFVTLKGYVLVWQPEHPLCNPNGYVFEHRLVMEQYLERYLRTDEVVHHINGNKKDNHIENLKLMTVTEHKQLEAMLLNGYIGKNKNFASTT